MPVYVSLLRGINVGPHKRIKMDQLRQCFEALGFDNVRTYINSGNVVFKAAKTKMSTSALSKTIEERLLSEFGFPIPLVSRKAAEISAAVANNPFLQEPGINVDKLHVMFLSRPLSSAAQKNLVQLTAPPERSHSVGQEIYLYLPNGVAESKLMKAPLDRLLSVVNTARNWKTVNQLAQMCRECE
jgi:uncharacterized protein (DUF1697 family)